MAFEVLPFRATISDYQRQADALLAAWQAGTDRALMNVVVQNHPKFLRTDVPWAQKRMTEAEMRATPVDAADAQLALARRYNFWDWAALTEYARAVAADDSYRQFETAVDAVVTGDAGLLSSMLTADSSLVRARSRRVCNFDPPEHRATLLHYVAANGVEGYRQKTPRNAVEIATLLLEADSEPDSLADMYGGKCTTMAMLVSSCHPYHAGLQVPLVHALVDYGASVESHGAGEWTSPLMTALAFGYADAAEALARRGARITSVAAAAGLGRIDDVRPMLSGASALDRHRATALAAQLNRVDILRLLLDAGEDPNRLNPRGNHGHSTPLHQAVAAGHLDVVRLLVERGARLDVRDTMWDGTPLGWAEHCNQPAIADYLRRHDRGSQDS